MDGHELTLIESFTGRRFVIDLRETEVDPEFTGKSTTTQKVHHSAELHVTTDKVLDALTVTPCSPASNRVIVRPGMFQWFDQLLEFEEEVESAPLPPYSAPECDPSIGGTVRWSILGAYRSFSTGKPALQWVHGAPNMGYPAVPPQIIPLALVKQDTSIVVEITAADILNIRDIHATYAPVSQYIMPPVQEKENLAEYGTDLKDGTSCLVIGLGQWWYFRNGAWSPQDITTSFDNTYYRKDITEESTRVDLPWAISAYPELLVIRDGQIMAPGDDYILSPGASAFITFTYILYPSQRVLLIRNPFLGAAYSPESDANIYQVFDIYVDGETGHDAFPGSETQPFRTLQTAFDSIPLSSKHGYRVYARRLKLADKTLSNQYGQQVYGTLDNRQMRWLQIYLEDDCEWDSTLDYAYVLGHVGTAIYTDPAQKTSYPFRLDHCVSYFADITLGATIVLAGGNSALLNVTSLYPSTLTLASGNISFLNQCNLYGLSIRTAAYGRAVQTVIAHLMGQSGGYFSLEQGEITQSALVSGCYLDFMSCTFRAAGTFNFTRLNCNSCINTPVNALQGRAPVFFNIQQGATLELTNCQISYINGNGVQASRVSVVNMQGGSIKYATQSGISLSNGCALYLNSADISNNGQHGVALIRGAQGEITNTTGLNNLHYGVFCQKYSTAIRDGATTLTGGDGSYYEDIPGGGVVAVAPQDLMPAHLNQKLIPGQGLAAQIISTGVPNSYRMQLDIDVAQLSLMLASGARKSTVVQYSQAIQPGQIVDFSLEASGTTHLSAVHRRINDPTPRVRTTEFLENTDNLFIHMDGFIGTKITDAGLRLHNRPELGYPVNSPYWVYSKTGMLASLPIYAAGAVTKFTANCNCPAGTNVRVAFSPNGGGLWYKWGGSSWVVLQGSSTLAMMATADTFLSVNSYPTQAWNALQGLGGAIHIDVCFLLSSTSSQLTPTVTDFVWEFTEQGYNLDITSQFTRMFYTNRAVFENNGARLDPPVLFTVVPVVLGTGEILAGLQIV